jgi:hypothetical protein
VKSQIDEFGGPEGGKQYLEWPAEYETLSLGMLKTYTSLPLHVNITVEGKCDNNICLHSYPNSRQK